MVCLCMGFCALMYVGRIIPKHIAFSKTNSLAYRFFFYQRRFSPGYLRSGRYVIISIHSRLVEHCFPCTVVKKIGCDEGEMLSSTSDGNYYCGNAYLGHAKSHSRKGLVLERYDYTGRVPEGKFFAVGSCPDSFDSRYIGFLEKKDVEAVAIPLF